MSIKRSGLVIAVFVLLLSVFPSFADSQVGTLSFIGKGGKQIGQSLTVYNVAVEDLNQYAGLLEGTDNALAVWKYEWLPTFYVSKIPDGARYVHWVNGYVDRTWVMIRKVQTNLDVKMYVPAKQEVGLIRSGYDCSQYLWCTMAENEK